jgi:FSR family fosmidomycin resistance protein-like MFS transporter
LDKQQEGCEKDMDFASTKKRASVSDDQALWSLGGTHFLNDLMTSVVPALLPLFKDVFHLSYTQAGLILLVSSLTSSVTQPVFGYISDQHPRPWLLPVGTLITGVGLALSGLMPSYTMLLVAIALSGLGSGLFHPEASRGAHLGAGTRKGRAQAIFQVGGNAGQAFGPLMLPLFLLATGIKGTSVFLLAGLIGAFFMARLIPWYKLNLVEEGRKAKKRPRGKTNIPGLVLLVTVVIFRSFAQIGIAGFLPFFYLHQGVPLRTGDLLTFFFLLAGALGTFLGGRFSDQLGYKWLLFGSMFVTIPFAWALPHVHGILAIIDLFLLGFFVLSSFAVTVVYGQLLLPDKVGLASGLMIGLSIGAGGIGAALLGWVSDIYGITTVFNLFVILPLLGAILTLFVPSEKRLVQEG